MSDPRLASLVVVVCSLCAMPSFAAESYVYCDNGLRCFKAPCPSNSALDLATGTIIKGVSIDPSGLPQADKAITIFPTRFMPARSSSGARSSTAPQTITGEKYNLPWLVATRIVRTAKDSERKHCSSH
ncbi:hypothetical protein [Mesorhizobium sp.]|uniref:hypothetical protein n=1 Tax=Mesorhizobium sp. TaxID=1871066 RepID=UPI0025F2CE48|nr:hypothetical protein [Mesorhizobium sp.]